MNIATALRTAAHRATPAQMGMFDTDELVERYSVQQRQLKMRSKGKKDSRREQR